MDKSKVLDVEIQKDRRDRVEVYIISLSLCLSVCMVLLIQIYIDFHQILFMGILGTLSW